MSGFATMKVEIEETAATIAGDERYLPAAVEAIKAARLEIERQVRSDGYFLATLEPYTPRLDAWRVVRRMCDATRLAGVGPMAAVAGTIAQEALEAMVREGCTHGWVDNGGDVALILDKPITMEVFSDPCSETALAFELGPTKGIIGICASSGKLGHSISFGNADIAVVIAQDACLADALATAIGNAARDSDSLRTSFEVFRAIDGFIGALVILDGKVAVWGELPRMAEVEHNPERLTAHTLMASSRFTGSATRTVEVRT